VTDNKNPPDCNTCKGNGYPGQKIKFEKIGVKDDGVTPKYKPMNLDGSEHKHKEKDQAQKPQTGSSAPTASPPITFAQGEEIIRMLKSIDQNLTVLNTKL
jgi:hypothetical protein